MFWDRRQNEVLKPIGSLKRRPARRCFWSHQVDSELEAAGSLKKIPWKPRCLEMSAVLPPQRWHMEGFRFASGLPDVQRHSHAEIPPWVMRRFKTTDTGPPVASNVEKWNDVIRDPQRIFLASASQAMPMPLLLHRGWPWRVVRGSLREVIFLCRDQEETGKDIQLSHIQQFNRAWIRDSSAWHARQAITSPILEQDWAKKTFRSFHDIHSSAWPPFWNCLASEFRATVWLWRSHQWPPTYACWRIFPAFDQVDFRPETAQPESLVAREVSSPSKAKFMLLNSIEAKFGIKAMAD